MTINQKGLFFVLILFCASIKPFASVAKTTDFRLRLSTKVENEFGKKLSASLEYEHRFNQNLTTFDKAFLEPTVSYQLIKPLELGLHYRLSLNQNKTREQHFEQRVASYLRYKFEFDDFEFRLKTILQYGFDDITNPSFSYDQKLVNRNSLEIQYNWFGTKITPFAAGELFYYINDPQGGILNQARVKAGAEYDINKHSKLQAYYMYESEFNVAFPVNSHTLGFGYSYKF